MFTTKSITHTFIPFLIFILVIFSIASCSESSKPNDPNKNNVPVTVMRVTKGTIENITQYAGLIQPKKLAYVVTAIPGKVSSTFFEVGDRVHEGDLLFTVDSTEIEDNIHVLEEQLKVAEANLSLAQAGVVAAAGSQYESQKIQLKTALKSAEDNFTAAKAAFDNATLYHEVGVINEFQYNQIKNQFKQAQNALESTNQAYELYETKVSIETHAVASNQLKQAQASYDMLKLQIENTRKKLSYTQITSPIDGMILSKEIISGCMISNTMVPYTIMDADTIQVAIAVTEQVINTIKKGEELDILIASVKSEPFKGVVFTVSPAVDQKTLTYSILIDVQNKDYVIKPGMTGKVGILTECHENSVLVPLSSILTNDNGSFVYTIENNHAIMKPVLTGITNKDKVEILEGIDAGEFLVVKGQQFLSQNDPVTLLVEGSK